MSIVTDEQNIEQLIEGMEEITLVMTDEEKDAIYEQERANMTPEHRAALESSHKIRFQKFVDAMNEDYEKRSRTRSGRRYGLGSTIHM